MTADRILTTHTGSLPRPPDLVDAMLAHERGHQDDAQRLWQRVAEATGEVVRRQADLGIDLVSDGEFGKASYAGYVKDRLSGFSGQPNLWRTVKDREEFPDWSSQRPLSAMLPFPSNNGPVRLLHPEGAEGDIVRFRAALNGLSARGFMSAASPGVIDTFMPSTYYRTDKEYLFALADALKPEYRAIVDAGFILQVDCPDLAMSASWRFADLSLAEFRHMARMHVQAVNQAIEGLPRDRVRLHLCWGNYEGPHRSDIPLRDILDVALEANVGGLSFEAANPRHAHEWEVFEHVRLPDDLVLIPGVIDSCTNYIEHPRLVAQRLERYAQVVARERVMAGTDCGFGTMVGASAVAPSVVWAKLESLVEGARMASQRLWS